MNNKNNTIGRAKTCCALCGEKLTSPIFFQGKIYGYSCIKKVNPTYKRLKTHYVVADSYTTTENENGSIRIDAIYQGTNNKPVFFWGIIHYRTYMDGRPFIDAKEIQLINEVAYIDLLRYKKGIF